MDEREAWYVFNINPEPWRVGPLSVGRKNGKPFPMMGRDQQLAAYQAAIRGELESDEYEKLSGPLTVTFFFWRRRDAYETQTERSHRKHEADATNLQKSTEDALQGYLYDNDKDNIHVESYLVAQGPDVQGKVVVRVAERKGGFNPFLLPSAVWQAIDQLETPVITTQMKESWVVDDSTF